VTCDDGTDNGIINATINAARSRGAKTAVLMTAKNVSYGNLADEFIPTPLASAVQSCDFWLEFNFPYITQSSAWEGAMRTDHVRHYFLTGLTRDSYVRLFGKSDPFMQLQFQEMIADQLRRAENLRITTPTGTDVSCALSKDDLPRSYGLCTSPGFHPILGQVAVTPVEGSTRGRVVLDGILHSSYAGVLNETIEVEVDEGVRSVKGTGLNAILLEKFLRKSCDGGYGDVVHFAYGLHPMARLTGNCFVEDIRCMGANAVGFGTRIYKGKGVQPDGLIFKTSVWLDGIKIMDEGNIQSPPQLRQYYEDMVGATIERRVL
jgi:2,5-dihydroxypyridine 5,6-dioxygenase